MRTVRQANNIARLTGAAPRCPPPRSDGPLDASGRTSGKGGLLRLLKADFVSRPLALIVMVTSGSERGVAACEGGGNGAQRL